MADISWLSGLRVLIVGVGREGLALATYLARHGLTVAATDLRSAAQLGSVATSLRQAGVSVTFGDHPVSLLDEADLLFVSPGVPLEVPFLREAKSRKIPLSTESRLFCHLCPAPILAITGSNGKTTTTTLLGQILEAGGRKTWVGGNIGRPLIEVVDQIEPDNIVVMELSSFQLEYFHARLNSQVNVERLPAAVQSQVRDLLASWSPPFSAILNITPNHLDRHPSMKHYVRAKRALIDYQDVDGTVILSLDNDVTRTIGNQFGAKVRWFSLEAQLPGGGGLIADSLALFDQQKTAHRVAGLQEIKLRGNHNLNNILAACLMAREAGATIETMHQVITRFTGVEHRLEFVREHNGAAYYNDSIATSPERLMAALRSFREPIVLLAGGRDKHLPWDEAVRLMLHKTYAVILFGEATRLIAREIHAVLRAENWAKGPVIRHCSNLEEAVQAAAQISRPGDVILLSPGCASFDAFSDFAQRGQRFRELVLAL